MEISQFVHVVREEETSVMGWWKKGCEERIKKNLKTDDINQEVFYTHALALHNIINGLMHSNYNRRVIKMI